jgi:trans-aconitate 2-methyltransferase
VTGEWDAPTYDRVADPQTGWGAAVLDRLPLSGDERVLDAGCGSGRVTEMLLARLPRGEVVALDASAAMLEEARRRLVRHADRVEFVQADLAQPLPIGTPVDAVLSTATFHWVLDHDALFRNLAAVIRPGGRLVAQCGGAGNIASLKRVLAGVGDGWPGAYTFATPAETTERLLAAGFVDVEAWLSEEPTRFEPGVPFETFLETVCLRQHLERLPAAERPAFVKAVAARMPAPELDYVRLNILARRDQPGRSPGRSTSVRVAAVGSSGRHSPSSSSRVRSPRSSARMLRSPSPSRRWAATVAAPTRSAAGMG